MSSSDIALSVRELAKAYTVLHNATRHTALTEAIMDRLRHPLQRAQRETFWALKGLNFEVNQGDIVGIIGSNGAGKSTLLKILSRITEPTRGEAVLYGRVGSLLEVGTGFHRELTGRENIYLNGSILGMTRQEITREFDAIVDFANVEKFIDTPVKRYSSGMYMRLAFAVAAHLRSEILVVDEVLAVGDMEFQKKCLGKMKDVATSGRTILFVSHNMQAISVLCNRGICLRAGQIIYDGGAKGAVEEYMAEAKQSIMQEEMIDRRAGSGHYRYTEVKPAKEIFAPDEEKIISFRIERKKEAVGGFLTGRIINETGLVIAQFDSRLVGYWLEDADVIEGGLSFTTPWLKPGDYRVRLVICPLSGVHRVIDQYDNACMFTVSPILPYTDYAAPESIAHGAVLADFKWTTWQPGSIDQNIVPDLRHLHADRATSLTHDER